MPGTPASPVPVVLAGARGHGRSHLRTLRRLAEEGLVRLVGICELTPVGEEELEGLGSPAQSDDLDALVARTGPEVTIVCTPIHTHAALGLVAARHGSHLLLEKPPTPSLASFRELSEGTAAAGVACQIGFQSLGSHAIGAIRALVAEGAIGEVRGIGAAGAWVRDEAYWRRSPWAGRRRLQGREVMDGVLTNPLAHALATALCLDGSDREEDIASVELEMYRANDIEVDDTSCARLQTVSGGAVVTAVTLCAERSGEPYVVVHGESGRITFWYKTDQVLLERAGQAPRTTTYGRTGLLANLLAHVREGEELLVPPERTGAFMRLVDAVRSAPEPVALPAAAWHTALDEAGPRRVIPGVDELTGAGAAQLALYSELGVPWALPAPHAAETG